VNGAADDDAVRELLCRRAEAEWLRGDVVQAMAAVKQVDAGRYRVRGLDADGHPLDSFAVRATEGVVDAFTSEFNDGGIFAAVRGDHPECAAVGLYQAARHDHTWLTFTPHRVAVLRLRDVQNEAESVFDQELARAKQDRSVRGAVRGFGKIVSSGAKELARSVRRPPLPDRPQDAVLEWPFEAPRHLLQAIESWKPRMMPTFRHGPRWVKVRLADGSWACFETDVAGATALTGGDER